MFFSTKKNARISSYCTYIKVFVSKNWCSNDFFPNLFHKASPRDLNDLPEYEDDDRSLNK